MVLEIFVGGRGRPVQAVLVDPASGIEPQATKVGVDILNADAEEHVRRQCALADHGVVDVRACDGQIIEVRKGVKDVESGALEQLQVVTAEVVRQGEKLALVVVVIAALAELGVEARKDGVFLDNFGG